MSGNINIDHLLPQDDELVRRENEFLKLFDKYSAFEENDDSELADLHVPDEMIDDDDRSGSTISETSSIDGGEDDGEDSRSVIANITKQLTPVIQRRVNSWPENGINLQLKTVDPSVSVDDWLKANIESTSKTETYKKIVVNEDRKNTTTTMKYTKTTTKEIAFNAIVPRFINAIKDEDNRHRIETDVAVGAIANDSSVSNSKNNKKVSEKQKKHKEQKKLKDATELNKLQVKISLSKLVDLSVINKPAGKNVKTIEKPKPPTKNPFKQAKKKNQRIDSKFKSKMVNCTTTPPEDVNGRCLRSRTKESIGTQVQDENAVVERPEVKVTEKRKKQDNQIASRVLRSRTAVPPKEETKSDHSFRSPLKNQQPNLQSYLRRNVRVNIERMPHDRVATSVRKQENTLERIVDGGANEIDAFSQSVSNQGPVIGSCDFEEPASRLHRSRKPRILTKNRVQKRRIVIHSPHSETLLGTRIDDTMMLVTKADYMEHIDPKYHRTTNVCNNSIIPICRQIVYELPTMAMDAIDESTDLDSECEDVLLTSYTSSGRIEQLNV